MHDVAAIVRALGIVEEVTALAVVPFVILRRKDPAATVAWILTLLFIPLVGILVFFLFGRDRIRAPKKRESDAQVKAHMLAVTLADEATARALIERADLTPLERSLFRVGANLTHANVTSGNKVTVFPNGDAVYDALGAAIDRARVRVCAEYYLIRNDATGAWFRDRLAAAAARGVEVRLLCDGFGSFEVGPRWMRPLKKAGARIARFLPLRSILLEPVNLRNHRKIVVVDGSTAFTGGLNIGDEYRGTMPGLGAWRDLHLQIDGPAARELERTFIQDWAFASHEIVEPLPASSIAPQGSASIAVVPSGPDTKNEAIHRMFFGAIACAERDVLITTPYFVPDESVLVALEFTAMRGVDVKIILPGRSNHSVTFHAGRSFYERLLNAGVQIYEYEPGMIHAKLLLADGHVALVGSANMDLRSFRLNFEVHSLIHDLATSRTLRERFALDLSRSKKIDPGLWRQRGRSFQLREGAARLVSPLL
jgi:cardiolipin synthase